MRCLVLISVLAACAPKPGAVRDVLGKPAPAVARVAVAPPRFLGDLERPADDMQAFRAGTWVGSIWFGGGYEILEEEDNQIRSVQVDLGDAETYRPLALEWLDRAIDAGAAAAGWQLVPLDVDPATLVDTPVRSNIRGTVKGDGRDNVNLPRFDLRPAPRARAVPLEGVDAVLVPIVVQYYAHNGGWFIGQERGTWAGARLRLLWSLHAPDGALLGWGEVGSRAVSSELASPNRQQMQDLLLEVEAEASQALGRQLATESASR